MERRTARALFICIGGEPRTGWAADTGVRTNRAGYILTGPDLLDAGRRPEGWPLDRDPLALETSVPGLFAAGDVAQRLDQASGGGSRRGRDGRRARPPPARGAGDRRRGLKRMLVRQ